MATLRSLPAICRTIRWIFRYPGVTALSMYSSRWGSSLSVEIAINGGASTQRGTDGFAGSAFFILLWETILKVGSALAPPNRALQQDCYVCYRSNINFSRRRIVKLRQN